MKILPNPQKKVQFAGTFSIDNDTKIYAEEQFLPIAKSFAQNVEKCNGMQLQFASEIDEAKIRFTFDEHCADQSYVLMVDERNGATVGATTPQGCFYAMQSLSQMLDLYLPHQDISCPNCYVQDEPKFAYRGLHLDICRHFFGVDVIKQIIVLMSQVKLNKLHLHLTDDQGFRIQIDKYPLLTEVGSVRLGSEVVQNGERYVEEKPHGGYLTKADVAEIVAFAGQHFIDVIPEIDIPGHFVAALAAYPEYSCTGAVAEVRKNWGISKDLLCAGNEDSYQFVCDILDEVCEMFPYEYIHLGGDEAPKDRWCNCKKCREKLSQLGLEDFEQLQGYMLEFFVSYLEQAGKKVICWNDGVHKQSSKSIVSQVWKPFTLKQGVKQANDGRKVIMSPFFNLYFDYPYAMTPLSKTLKYNPLKGVKKENIPNVLGVEGALWTEYVADEEKLYFNLLPRLDALANCAWGGGHKSFKKALEGRLQLYQSLGLTFNSQAFGKGRRVSVIKKFFKNDADVEVKNHKKHLLKQAKKQQKKQDK